MLRKDAPICSEHATFVVMRYMYGFCITNIVAKAL